MSDTTPSLNPSAPAKFGLKMEAAAKANHPDPQLVTFTVDGATATVNAQDVQAWLNGLMQMRVGSNNKTTTEISPA